MERGKIYEVETQRTNISANQFFSHCRRTYEKKTGQMFWLEDFEQWVNPLQPGRSEARHEDWDIPQREICKTMPYDWQFYLQGEYNFIMEWFDGNGYMYAVEWDR